MIFGLLAGGILKRDDLPASKKVGILLAASAIGFIAGLLLAGLNLCPIVKRIWTPSWALFAAGWTFLILSLFYDVIDRSGWRRWAFPLVVVGMNSIAMYVLAHLAAGFIASSLRTVFRPHVFEIFGTVYEPMVEATVVLFVLWLVLYWMYRRKIFLRI